MAAHVPLGILLAWVKSWKMQMPFLTRNHKFGTFSTQGVLSHSSAERRVVLGANTPSSFSSASRGSPAAPFPQ